MRARLWILLAVCIAFAAALMPAVGASGSRSDVAMLKKIASRVDERAGVIAIEASDPVAYVASQPDARTFVVELREVVALGFADNFTADPRHPVAAVHVESAKAVDGVNVARVRMELRQPTRPHVRSARCPAFGIRIRRRRVAPCSRTPDPSSARKETFTARTRSMNIGRLRSCSWTPSCRRRANRSARIARKPGAADPIRPTLA